MCFYLFFIGIEDWELSDKHNYVGKFKEYALDTKFLMIISKILQNIIITIKKNLILIVYIIYI